MRFTNNHPLLVEWVTRIIIYSIVLLIIWVLIVGIFKGRTVKTTIACVEETSETDSGAALGTAQAIGYCLYQRSTSFENWLMRSTHQALGSLPNAPCEFVGEWESYQHGCTYTVRLREDSTFRASPVNCDVSSKHFSGNWGVSDNLMVWMYNHGRFWPPDINIIESREPGSFVLAEENRSRTRFTRLRHLYGGSCWGQNDAQL